MTADPGRAFAVSRTEHGAGTIAWRYDFSPDGSGTAVVESYEVVRTVPMAFPWVLRVVFGVRDQRADLHANMETSLGRLAKVAEREAART